ncbi:MAG: S8 family serine peptidase [Pirellula sp.]|nr:S8 family serine peptidase [Pirellula sp.]
MPTKARRARSSVAKRLSRRRLFVENLENRVVLTAQYGFSPLIAETPLAISALSDLQGDRPSEIRSLDIGARPTIGPQLSSGMAPAAKVVGLSDAQGTSDIEIAPGRWITRFSGLDGPADQQVARLQQWFVDAGVADIQVSAPLGLPGMVALTTSPDLSYDQLSASLAKIAGFQYASADYKVWGGATYPNDLFFNPFQYAQDNYGQDIAGYPGLPDADIDAPEAWDLTTGSSSVVVGVIDSGIDFTHPDLIDNIWTNPGETPNDGIDNDSNGFIDDVHGWDFWGSGNEYTTADDDNNPSDEHGHGTHVSGTIGATGNNLIGVAGVAWDVSILPLRFLGPNNYGWISDAVRAINYATALRTSGINLKVTNHSWGGGGYYQPLVDAIAAHEAAGILFVASAGNNFGNNNDFFPSYPASYGLDNIISVAATDNQDQLAFFSNIGPTSVDLGAPGSFVASTLPNSIFGYEYGYFSGTSMAAPQVTGVAALAWSMAPDATYQQVKEAILKGVDPIPALEGRTATGGRLNAYNTLKQLGIQVVSTEPAVNDLVTAKPTQYVVNFSDPYDPASIDASDFTVNGQSADGFLLTDLDTITFTFSIDPITSEGEQTMEIAPSAIDPDPTLPSIPFTGFMGTFRYDALLLQVDSTTPANPGGIFTLPAPFTYDVHFNEAIDPTSLTPSDLVLSGLLGATVSDVTVSANGLSASFTIAGIRDEGTLTTSIAAGAIKDIYGNDGASFSANYVVDYGTAPFPVPLKPIEPLGSLIYEATQRGIIDPAGDTDSFTIKVDPGQTITAVVEASGTLRSTVKIFGPNGSLVASSTAAAPGRDALIQTYRVPGKLLGGGVGPSAYTVVVGGTDGTTGSYKLQLILNAAVEPENNGGATNDSMATAFDIGNSFLSLTNANSNAQLAMPQRGAVIGEVTAAAPIVPNYGRSPVPANSGNAYPFVLDPFGINSMRYQQIYSADQFPNGGLIDEVRFRRTIFSETTITDLQLDVEVRLSYAARSVSNASSVFADNVGADLTTVYDGILTMSSTSTTYPLPFDAVIDVDDTFFYDPSRGDLLVDFFVRDSNYPFPAYFESTVYPAPDLATTRIYSFSVDDRSGIPGLYYNDNLPYGLITQIAFNAQSDPADWYKFELRSGQSATVAMNLLAGSDAKLELVGPTGGTLAVSSPDQASNVDQIISNFLVTSSGTYYVKVTSEAGARYSLVVDRNADFDAENNDSIATAQELIVSEAAANRWVHGYLGSKTISVNAADTGWFDSNGYHNPFDKSYYAGGGFGYEYRNFFVFDLPDDTTNIVGAQLVLSNPYMYGSDPSETFSLFDVSTPIDALTSFSTDRMDIFQDLGTGALYASTDVPVIPYNYDPNRLTTVDFGEAGIGALKQNAGRQLAFGGAITSLASEPFQLLFDYAYDFSAIRQLQLEVVESDFYRIRADKNRTIVIETSTPAIDSGEFVNELDPIIRLYDPAGKLVATNDNGASDGRNAKLTYKIPNNAEGDYSIEVASAPGNPAKGEYILSVKGSARSLPGFEVVDTDPSTESLVYTSPQQIEVDFNDSVLATTLQSSDLQLNGRPAASATLVDGDTVRFQNNLAFQWTPELGGNGHYYALTSGIKTWQASQAEAASLGGNLVTVNDQLEQNFLKRVFFSGPNRNWTYWIGLNDIGEEGNFVWASGEPVEFTNWAPFEPNDGGIGEDGVQINFDPFNNNGAWNDLWDTYNFYGIIELNSLPANFALVKEGLNTFSLAAGAMSDIQGTALKGHSGSFTLDTTPPVVLSTSVVATQIIPEGPVDISVTFSEAMDTSTYGIYLPVYGQYNGASYYPFSATWSADATVLTLSYEYLPEDAYELRLFGSDGTFQDLLGLDLDGDLDLIEGGEFVLQFFTDSGTREIPTPLVEVQPASSLIYQTPYAVSGTIVPDGDTDDWTIYLDPTQTLTVLLHPSFGGLAGTVEVLGPDESLLASANASDPFSHTILQTVRVSNPGIYTVRIGGVGGSAGPYSFEVTLNAALEEEAYGSLANNELSAAQSIEASFIPLATGAERGAVRGVSGDDDFYSFDLAAGQSLTASISFDSSFPSFVRTDYYMGSPWSVEFGDVNNDGNLDMVTSNGFSDYQLSIRLGNGDGTFGNNNGFGSIYSYRLDFALADVNGDDLLDVIGTNYYGGFNSSSVFVQLGNGDGTFQDAIGFFAGYYNYSVAVGDITGDGIPDIVTTVQDNRLYLLPGNGDGTFGDLAQYQVGSFPTDVALADVDGINGLDIVTSNLYGGYEGRSLSILENQGNGLFGDAIHYAAGFDNIAVAVGDLNGDGAPDLVTANYYSTTVQVLFNSNDNTGNFGVPIEYSASGYNASSVVLGDVDGDDVLDIVTGSFYNQFFSAGMVSILTNNGDGSFGSAEAVESAYGTRDIALADLNADGKLDIAAAGYWSSTVSVLLNLPNPKVLTLFAPDGTELLSSEMGDAEWDVILSGFVASESGTYTIRQSSPPFAIQYSLIVTRDFEVATSAPLRVAEGESSKRTQELPQDDSKQELQRLNRNRPYDVDNDGQVSPIDVLVLINSLNSVGRRNLANLHVEASGTRFYDVDNDGVVSPLDVLQVINYLNSPVRRADRLVADVASA